MAPGSQWWETDEEYRFLQSVVVIIVCATASMFDSAMHALKRWVAEHDPSPPSPEDVAKFFTRLFERSSAELMVLGFLALLIWIISRSSGFDAIVASLPGREGGGDGCGSYGGRRLADAAGCRRLAEAEEIYGRAPFNYPSTASDLLHIVEDVHIQIFVAMLCYFLLMAATISYAKHKCELFQHWEEEFSAYQRFPKSVNRADWRRLLLPLSDVKDYFRVKAYFIGWARSGALRHIEEKRARQRDRERSAAEDVRFSFKRRGRRNTEPAPTRGSGPLRGSGPIEDEDSVDVRINDGFHLADYLSLSFANQLDGLVQFKPLAWGLVCSLAAVEAVALYFGSAEIVVDLVFATITVVCLLILWGLSKKFSRDVIRAAEGEKGMTKGVSFLHVYFLRMLQALVWRNLFWLSVFFLGPQLREHVANPSCVPPQPRAPWQGP